MNPKWFLSSLENLFTESSLAEILTGSSFARLVDVLFDVLWVRKLFHRRMWFLMSHLSCSWREVLITLFEEHSRKCLGILKVYFPVQIDLSSKKCENQMENSVACYFGVPLYTFHLSVLLASFKIFPMQASLLPVTQAIQQYSILM